MQRQDMTRSSLISILAVCALGIIPVGSASSQQARETADSAGKTMSVTDQNKANVVAFYNKALNDKNVEEAAKFLGPEYRQHNPKAIDGRERLAQYVGVLRQQFRESHSEILRVFAVGNYVILHVHTKRKPAALGMAIAEFFRLDGGKIVEHWDVIQDVPQAAANQNTMF